MTYDWPGNVRELEDFMKKIVQLEDLEASFEDPKESIGNSPKNVTQELSLAEMARMAEEKVERKVIGNILKRNGWNRKKTAQMLQISYRCLLSKIKKLEIGK